jgi:RNA polymerase sigma-70 factor (ECF subfamily)
MREGMEQQEWVKRIQEGDEYARERLYTEFKQRLYATAVHFLGFQDPEAEDAVHETYVRAFQGIAGFRFESGLYTWLNHICVNVCFDRIRARKRNLVKQEEDLEGLSLKAAKAQHARGQEKEEKEEALEKLRQAVAKLGEPCQSLVRARDLEGKSYVEVSRLLKVPLGTVMSRLSRCREKLKEIFMKSISRDQP